MVSSAELSSLRYARPHTETEFFDCCRISRSEKHAGWLSSESSPMIAAPDLPTPCQKAICTFEVSPQAFEVSCSQGCDSQESSMICRSSLLLNSTPFCCLMQDYNRASLTAQVWRWGQHTLPRIGFPLACRGLGIVYGDIGTSPLYVFQNIFLDVEPTKNDVLGATSLVLWTIVLIVLIKYSLVVLLADDNGEGATLITTTWPACDLLVSVSET